MYDDRPWAMIQVIRTYDGFGRCCIFTTCNTQSSDSSIMNKHHPKSSNLFPIFIVLLLLLYQYACKSTSVIGSRYHNISQSIEDAWVRDTCGFVIGDRAAIAGIYSHYLNNQRPKPRLHEVASVLGKPNEIRDNKDGLLHWYYYISVKNCAGDIASSGFVLDVVFHKNKKRILGSSIYIWEPEDN
jgi:hypothetical protein